MIDVAMMETMLEQIGTTTIVQEIDTQIALLLGTQVGTIPLARDLGVSVAHIDDPAPLAQSLYTAEITEAIATFIPAVQVQEVTWSHNPTDGKVTPKVVITSA